MSHADSQSLRIAQVAPNEWALAVPLLWNELPPEQRERAQSAILDSTADWPAEIWGAYRGEILVGAMRAQVQPGKSALVAAPRLVSGEPTATAVALLERVLAVLRGQNVQVVQALLGSAEREEEILRAGGLKHVGELIYMLCLGAQFPQSPPNDSQAEALTFDAYTPERHARFAHVVERTYQGSLDCPAAEGLRSIDDVLATYRGTGPFDPNRWLIAREGEQDVGCLIIADEPAHDQSELMYIGVTPEARGRKLGASLVQHAQWLTREAGRSRLVLAVDAGNHPAIAMYSAAGFIQWNWRSVFLRAL
jgi:mycothiol synthase